MQGFNMGRYVPPHLEGTTSFNQASGKNPQRRNPDGSQTVRFECPFAIWCTTCIPEAIIAQGVRFNAQKKQVGKYFSSPIWGFRFKHTVCGGWIEIRTDPKNTEYVCFEGARRRDYGGGAGGSGDRGEILFGGAGLEGDDNAGTTAGGIESVLNKLEKKRENETAAEREKARVEELKRRSERDWADPYEVNKKIRRDFRVGRRERAEDRRTGEGLKEKFGLGLEIVEPAKEDGERARLVDFGGADSDQNGAGAGAVSMGLFERSHQSKMGPAPGKDIGKKGKTSASQTKLRTTLRDSLRGNSRAKQDPFWGQNSWHRTTAPRRAEDVHVNGSESEGEVGTASTTPANDDDDEDDDDNEKASATTGTNAATNLPGMALVAYDSD